MRKKAIDLFCGIGGFHQAAKQNGVDILMASDIDADCRWVYEKNHGLKPLGDVTKIQSEAIPDHDILFAGFPCQAFSIAGKKAGFSDTRGTLFFEIERILRAKQPKAFLLENVKNILTHDNENTIKTIKHVIDQLGYDLTICEVNAAQLGCPTARKRVYFVGFRKDLKTAFQLDDYSQINLEKNKLKYYLDRVSQRDLKDLSCYKIQYHTKQKNKYAKEVRVKNLLEPIRLGTINNDGQGNRIYSVEGPAITFAAYGGGVASKTGAYLIRGKVRKLSVSEGCRVMGFPEGFQFKSINSAYQQLGNSVVVNVVDWLLKQILRHI